MDIGVGYFLNRRRKTRDDCDGVWWAYRETSKRVRWMEERESTRERTTSVVVRRHKYEDSESLYLYLSLNVYGSATRWHPDLPTLHLTAAGPAALS